ncbi:hypothetical protein GmHk_16G046388 [Glycine max]|nr:hypothetical protein GmHk_16G046388 [Glycine max]
MYENLNDVSKSRTRQLAGYITVLQCWIYEHFSSVSFAIVAKNYDERKPCACRWKFGKALPVSTYRKRLDILTSDVVAQHPVVATTMDEAPEGAHVDVDQPRHAVCWIYKNFPFAGFVIAAEDYDERKPCACRWKFGKALHIRWGPSIVIHRPERIVRQFRHVQTIPPHPPAPSLYVAQHPVVATTMDEAPEGQMLM